LEPHKWVKFREWKNVEETKAIVTDAMDKYQRMAALYKKKRLN
jgi:inorganic pyrophosphatase